MTETIKIGLAHTERTTYEQMWAVDAYAQHSPGEGLVPVFLEIARRIDGPMPDGSTTVLDAGAGSGKGALALMAAGLHVAMCDLTDAGLVPEALNLRFESVALWDDVAQVVGRHDYVYCCDVMEHIPPTFTMLVASRLLAASKRGVFFSISLVPDQFGAWVGKSLHQSVQSFVQWRDQLATLGEVVEARDLLTSAIYFVRARC